MAIIERGAPGGVNVNITKMEAEVGDTTTSIDPEENTKLAVPADQPFTLNAYVENSGGTGFLSDDNCDDGSGTLLQGVWKYNDQTITTTLCQPDEGAFGAPKTNTHLLNVGGGDNLIPPNSNRELKFWVRGANTNDRMTPKFRVELSTGVGEVTEPGDFSASIVPESTTFKSETYDTARAGLSLDDFPGLPAVEPGEQLTIASNIENAGSTSTFDPNSCTASNGKGGTELRYVALVNGTDKYAVDRCIQDNPLIGDPKSLPIVNTFPAPDDPDIAWSVELWVELGDGTRVTPQYKIRLETVDVGDNEESDLKDVEEEPPEEEFDPGTDEDFTLDLSNVDTSCSVSSRTITERQSADFEVELSNYLPPGEDSVEIPIEFRVDGEVYGTASGFASVNGANGDDVTLSGLSPGTHTLSYRIGNEAIVDCGEIAVEAVFDPGRVSLDCRKDVATLEEGGTVTLTVTGSNDNQFAANVVVEVKLNGDEVGSRSFDIPAGETATQDIPISMPDAGQYNIEVDYTSSKA